MSKPCYTYYRTPFARFPLPRGKRPGLAYSIVKVLALLTNSVAQFVLKFINRMNLYFRERFGERYFPSMKRGRSLIRPGVKFPPRWGLASQWEPSLAWREATSTVRCRQSDRNVSRRNLMSGDARRLALIQKDCCWQ